MAKVLPTGTDIQIATDAAFMSVVIDDEGGYKTSRSFTRGDLPYGVNLYARIRHTHPQAGTSYWSPTIRFKVITPASAIGVCLDNTDTTKKGVFYWIDAAGNKVDSFNFQNHPTYAGISMTTLDADRAPVTMTKIPLFYIKTAAAGPVDSFAAGKKCWWLSDGPLPGFRPAACFKRSTETDANGKRVIAPYCYVGTYLGQQETVDGKNCIGSKKSQTIVSLPKDTADQYITNRNVTDGKLYVEDVFSTYLYTGNNSTQTINNGIDLSGYGGLVWIKNRQAPQTGYGHHNLFDTQRGSTKFLMTDRVDAQISFVGEGVTVFGNSGFTVAKNIPDGDVNEFAKNYASWTFRRAPKFFDIVTWTGDGVAGRQILHNLGCEPGMIIIKCLDNPGTGNVYHWSVWHRSVPGQGALLDTADAFSSQTGYYCITGGDVSSFYVTINPKVNFVSAKYVAYVFAHNADSDGLIQCGSYGPGASRVTLGWEPQYILTKAATSAGSWGIYDNARSLGSGFSKAWGLQANRLDAELTNNDGIQITSTGFNVNGSNSIPTNGTDTFIYLAIRRPNKPPKTGAEVYNAIARTGTGANATVTGVGFAPDIVISKDRNKVNGFGNTASFDRLRGKGYYLQWDSTNAENYHPSSLTDFGVDGFSVGSTTDGSGTDANRGGDTLINWCFRRSPGFFDIVCDTGVGYAHAINHSLTVAPELIIRKSRNATAQWELWHSALASTEKLVLNSAAAKATDAAAFGTLPTATQFYVGASSNTNTSAATYVTYLFATCPGVSKVFSFTGNGTSLSIDCGFTAGARFVLIKRTDDTGDWFVWDSVRGIALGNDPHLSLNSTAAEVTTDDAIDPWSSGFIVKQNTATNVNVSGGEYIGLAIA